jgi:hypothetical protein
MTALVPKPEKLAPLARTIRGERVMLDADLAAFYGVPTKASNQAVKRNQDRFPADFMFQLTADEWWASRSQSVTASNSSTAMRSQSVTTSHRNINALPPTSSQSKA